MNDAYFEEYLPDTKNQNKTIIKKTNKFIKEIKKIDIFLNNEFKTHQKEKKSSKRR